jgi:hypothetical protein
MPSTFTVISLEASSGIYGMHRERLACATAASLCDSKSGVNTVDSLL